MDKKSTTELLMDCIRCSIFAEEYNSAAFNEISINEWKQIYSLSAKHDLSHIICDFFLKNKFVGDDKLKDVFNKRIIATFQKHTLQEYELERIKGAFEKNDVPFVALKGAAIRYLYPIEWFRSSCDIDVLVEDDRLECAQNILKRELNYVEKEHGFHDVLMDSPSGVHLELHFSLLEDRSNIDSLLEKAWQYSSPINSESKERVFTPEFQIFHTISHLYYHFLSGGCGIKPFIDIKLLLGKTKYNKSILNEMLEFASIKTFFDKAIQLSNIWFGDGEHDEMTREFAEYILNGGVYGTIRNKILVDQAQIGKTKSFFNRIFVPYNSLRILYPKIKKWQTPFFEIVRLIDIIKRGSVGTSVQELEMRTKTKSTDIEKVQKVMKYLNINE